MSVCKVFFLTTLGFAKNNDSVLQNALSGVASGSITPKPDGRGKAKSTNKVNREFLRSHIESFNPTISQYRREYAPNQRCLP